MSQENAELKCRREFILRELVAIASKRHRVVPDNHGVTLIELLLVLVILGILFTLAIPAYKEARNYAKISRCAEDIRSLETAIDVFQVDRGFLPDNLTQAAQIGLIDPWGRSYEYHVFGVGGYTPYEGHFGDTLNTNYDLYSLGENGETAKSVAAPLDPRSKDDIVRAGNGAFVGKADAFDQF